MKTLFKSFVAASLLLALTSCGGSVKVAGYETVIPDDAMMVMSVDISSVLDKVDLKALGSPLNSAAVRNLLTSSGVDPQARVYFIMEEFEGKEDGEFYLLAKVSDVAKVRDGLRSLSDDIEVSESDDYTWVKNDDSVIGLYNSEYLVIGVGVDSRKDFRKFLQKSPLSRKKQGNKYFRAGGDLNVYISMDRFIDFAVNDYSSYIDEDVADVLANYKNACVYGALSFNDGEVTMSFHQDGVEDALKWVKPLSKDAFSYLPTRSLALAAGFGVDGKEFLKWARLNIDDFDEYEDEISDYISLSSLNGSFAASLNGVNSDDEPVVTAIVPGEFSEDFEDAVDDFRVGKVSKYSYITNDRRFTKDATAFDAKDFGLDSDDCFYFFADFARISGIAQNVLRYGRENREIASVIEQLSKVFDCLVVSGSQTDYRMSIYTNSKRNSLSQITEFIASVALGGSRSFSSLYDEDDYDDGFSADEEDDWDW